VNIVSIIGAVAAGTSALTTIATAAFSDMMSEEARTRLEGLPRGLLALAARLLARDLRESRLDEWSTELHVIIREERGKPITRLLRGVWYALGVLVAAARMGRVLARTGSRRGTRRLVTRVSWKSGDYSGKTGAFLVRGAMSRFLTPEMLDQVQEAINAWRREGSGSHEPVAVSFHSGIRNRSEMTIYVVNGEIAEVHLVDRDGKRTVHRRR
jgi:hypothetical protein